MLTIVRSAYWPGQTLPVNEFVQGYRDIYRRGQGLFDEFNPCKVSNGTCLQGRTREAATDLKSQQKVSFCCSGCEHLSLDGCATNALWCKLWVCDTIVAHAAELKEFRHQLHKLNDEASRLCLGHGGRRGLGQMVLNFYGEEKYEEWKTTEASTTAISSMSAG